MRAAIPARRIAIVGVGLIGGSIGLGMRRLRPRVHVTGVDRRRALRLALRRGALDAAAASLAAGLRDADLVILALPVDAILSLLPRIARHALPGAVITDVGSTKEVILSAARRAGLARRFVGGHPMAGSQRSGVAHADPALFAGAPWFVCAGGSSAPAAARVTRLVRRLGAHPVPLPPRRHDEVVARLSHLPQLASVALVNAATRSPAAAAAIRHSGPAFRQMGRLSGSSPRLWRGILRTNRGPIASALGDLERAIRRLRRDLGRGAGREFRRAARHFRPLEERDRGSRC